MKDEGIVLWPVEVFSKGHSWLMNQEINCKIRKILLFFWKRKRPEGPIETRPTGPNFGRSNDKLRELICNEISNGLPKRFVKKKKLATHCSNINNPRIRNFLLYICFNIVMFRHLNFIFNLRKFRCNFYIFIIKFS